MWAPFSSFSVCSTASNSFSSRSRASRCIWMDSWASWMSSGDIGGIGAVLFVCVAERSFSAGWLALTLTLVLLLLVSLPSIRCGCGCDCCCWFRSCDLNRCASVSLRSSNALRLFFHCSRRSCQSRDAYPSSQVSMTRIPTRVDTILPSRFPSALSVARSSLALFSNFHRNVSSNTEPTFMALEAVDSRSDWSSFRVLVRACWSAVWSIVLFPVTALSCSSLSWSCCRSLAHLACHCSAAVLAAKRAAALLLLLLLELLVSAVLFAGWWWWWLVAVVGVGVVVVNDNDDDDSDNDGDDGDDNDALFLLAGSLVVDW
mmetsp:Transcript_18902/g.39753  ORF Transcript_18902/g.39753 Transcript_18902/m.39753 type:complete len:316 (-) Transcript_18902:316-1263(-)